MRIDPQALLIILDVEIFHGDKSRIVRMALDTGATFMVIPWNVVEVLGYDPAAIRQRIPITTASGVEMVPLLTLEKVKALEKEVAHVQAVCHDLPRQSAVDGLLGLSFLKQFDINLYFRQQRLELL